MIRIACALQLAALAVLAVFLLDPSGGTATAFSFAGIPLVGLSFLLSALDIFFRISRWRRTRHEGKPR